MGMGVGHIEYIRWMGLVEGLQVFLNLGIPSDRSKVILEFFDTFGVATSFYAEIFVTV